MLCKNSPCSFSKQQLKFPPFNFKLKVSPSQRFLNFSWNPFLSHYFTPQIFCKVWKNIPGYPARPQPKSFGHKPFPMAGARRASNISSLSGKIWPCWVLESTRQEEGLEMNKSMCRLISQCYQKTSFSKNKGAHITPAFLHFKDRN